VASQAKPSQSSQSQNQLIKSSQVKSSRSHSQLVPTDRLLCLSSIKNEDLPRSSGCLASPLFHTLCCFSLPLSLSLPLPLYLYLSTRALEPSNPRPPEHSNSRTLHERGRTLLSKVKIDQPPLHSSGGSITALAEHPRSPAANRHSRLHFAPLVPHQLRLENANLHRPSQSHQTLNHPRSLILTVAHALPDGGAVELVS